jgi:hypothetical protein
MEMTDCEKLLNLAYRLETISCGDNIRMADAIKLQGIVKSLRDMTKE